MGTFKRRRSPRTSGSPEPQRVKQRDQSAVKNFDRAWGHLQSLCRDPDSQHRLAWLQGQFAKHQRGAMESAQAEVDIATFLVNAGFSLSFVKERATATADLECYLEHDRMFVEVTVIVPTEVERSNGSVGQHAMSVNEEGGDFYNDALVRRILARIQEKSDQLANYSAPVLLALTIVHQEQSASENGKTQGRKMALDLQQLGGILTAALGKVHQLSGILLTLWNIQPAESRSNVRLSNVSIGEWLSVPKGFSQVRCLAINPTATYPLEPHASYALQRVL